MICIDKWSGSGLLTDLGVQPSNCTDDDLRLVNGNTRLEGRLEVCLNHAWGTVSRTRFDSSEATVVCRKLGLLNDYSESY